MWNTEYRLKFEEVRAEYCNSRRQRYHVIQFLRKAAELVVYRSECRRDLYALEKLTGKGSQTKRDLMRLNPVDECLCFFRDSSSSTTSSIRGTPQTAWIHSGGTGIANGDGGIIRSFGVI